MRAALFVAFMAVALGFAVWNDASHSEESCTAPVPRDGQIASG